ncbi:hypothetical protein [Aureimonas ureilytica]|uniref:hypothetical protein n=1 Tax=Aureimonas ureilytica TaxID=401562 RepID=UPI000369FE3B|nr:hypothetical protein [Aureimonas ureilytica]
MSVAFFDDPENLVILKICRTSPGFIPIVIKGKLHPVREANLDLYPVPSNLSMQDYVLGLEVLGCKLIRDGVNDVVIEEPAQFKSDMWRRRARQIQAIITDDWEGRWTELSDYLHGQAR